MSAQDFFFIAVAVALLWCSGVIPIALLALGAVFAAIAIGILSVCEKVIGTTAYRKLRRFVRKITGAEERTIRRMMANYKRKNRRASLNQVIAYEKRIRQIRSR